MDKGPTERGEYKPRVGVRAGRLGNISNDSHITIATLLTALDRAGPLLKIINMNVYTTGCQTYAGFFLKKPHKKFKIEVENSIHEEG